MASTAHARPADPLHLTRGASSTLSQQLAQRLTERIQQRLLAPGARLPSVRESAARWQVSPSTVVGAYDLLQAQGLVQARPQRGFFVREAPREAVRSGAAVLVGNGNGNVNGNSDSNGTGANAQRSGNGPLAHEPGAQADGVSPGAIEPTPPLVDATALIRGMFRKRGGSHPNSPGLGTLPEAWLDGRLLQRALRRVIAGNAPAGWLSYGEPAGDPGLREALSQRLADLGVRAPPAQIVTTVGASHAMDLIARTILKPGDAVLIDEPGWAIEFARLTQLGMRLLPVPRGPDGPDIAVMETLARLHQPRAYITVPVLHNPTGASLSPAFAHQVLRLAEAHDFTIVEDDTYAWLAEAHATRMAQLDGLKRTVYVSGFSKILVPQWRVGYVAASPELTEKLIDSKLLSTLTTPAPLEQAVAVCLQQGALRRHAERITTRLAAARTRTVRLAREAGCHFVAQPQGLFGWLDVGVDTEALAQALLDEGWFTAPGTLFHASPRPCTLMRVNFATAQDAKFWQRLQALRLIKS